jgi:hypothetical protein
MQNIPNISNKSNKLEEINNMIKNLKEDYKENVNFLILYDKQKYYNVNISLI